jgi:hypothetical protein
MTIIDQDQYSAMLAKWRGSPARIWIFDVSLTRLGVRLARVGEPEVLYVVGASCEHIVGPFLWSDSEISIIPNQEPGASSDLVVDKKAGFELRCRGVVMLVGPAGDLDKTFASFLGDAPLPQTATSS